MAANENTRARSALTSLALMLCLALLAAACGSADDSAPTNLAIDLTQETTLDDPAPSETDDISDEPVTPESVASAPPPAAPEATAEPAPTLEPASDAEPEPTAAPEPTAEPAPDESSGAEPIVNDGAVVFVGEMANFPAADPTILPDPGDYPTGEPGVASSLDAPVPMGTAFLYNDRDVQWSITLHGLYPTEPTFSSDEGSGCLLLIGTVTPTWIGAGLASRSIDLPDFAAILDGEAIDDRGSCDDDAAKRAGFEGLLSAEVMTGASFDFATSFLFEDQQAPPVQAIRVGDEDEDQTSWFTPSIIQALPAPSTSGQLAFPAARPLAGATLTAGISDQWALRMHGLIETAPTSTGINQLGEGSICLTLVGDGFPVKVEDGAAVSDTEPSFALLAGGRLIDGGSTWCETDALDDAGFDWIATRHQTPGSPISWASSFLVPERLIGSISHVVVAEWTDDDMYLFTPDVITDIPAPAAPRVDALLPVTSGSMGPDARTWVNVREEISWDIVAYGMVDLGPATFDSGTCRVVVGEMTPDTAVDKGFQGPDMWLIAQGTAIDALDQGCDTESLEALGYEPWTDFELAAGETFNYFAPVTIPDNPSLEPSVFVIGNPARSGQAIYLEPVELDTAPPT